MELNNLISLGALGYAIYTQQEASKQLEDMKADYDAALDIIQQQVKDVEEEIKADLSTDVVPSFIVRLYGIADTLWGMETHLILKNNSKDITYYITRACMAISIAGQACSFYPFTDFSYSIQPGKELDITMSGCLDRNIFKSKSSRIAIRHAIQDAAGQKRKDHVMTLKVRNTEIPALATRIQIQYYKGGVNQPTLFEYKDVEGICRYVNEYSRAGHNGTNKSGSFLAT